LTFDKLVLTFRAPNDWAKFRQRQNPFITLGVIVQIDIRTDRHTTVKHHLLPLIRRREDRRLEAPPPWHIN